LISINTLFVIAQRMGIKIIYEDLHQSNPHLEGYAWPDKEIIALDKTLHRRSRQHKCVLSEEIGHFLYPPRPGHKAFHERYFQMSCQERGNLAVTVAQDEQKALTFATGLLIPDAEFWDLIQNQQSNLRDLMEHFDVEEWFVRVKIGFIRRKARDAGQKLKWKHLIRR
jgi:Zn-dependent peptidase ImmA (M78 family)